MNFLELTKEAEAYGRLLARVKIGGGNDADFSYLDQEINKTASTEEISEEDQYLMGRIAASAYIDEHEKMAAGNPALVGTGLKVLGAVGALGAAAGAGALATKAVQNYGADNMEDRLVEKMKQANPQFRAYYGSRTPQQQAIIGQALRYRNKMQELAEGYPA